jgi:hypothetical protein
MRRRRGDARYGGRIAFALDHQVYLGASEAFGEATSTLIVGIGLTAQ